MSRAGSPSQSRREPGHNNPYGNNSNYRQRPGGVTFANGGGPNSRVNSSRGPSPVSAQPPPSQQQPKYHHQQHQKYHHQQQQQQAAHASVSRSLSVLFGQSIKLKLSDVSSSGGDRWVEGKLWCYDPLPGVVILESASPTGAKSARQTYRMVKLNQVREVQALGGTSTSGEVGVDPAGLIPKLLEPIRPINVTAVAMRETHAVRADDARRARIGQGVSRWGQEIFDALGKTLPVRWHQTSIIILDDVLLTGPRYRPEDVKMNAGNATPARLARVKQVLKGEWTRLLKTEEGQQMERETRPASSSNNNNNNDNDNKSNNNNNSNNS